MGRQLTLALVPVIALLSLGYLPLRAADAPKKNVLLIISDDLTTTSLGCYGHDVARTPNVDALAARGVRFDHAYCQFPLCNPSRCSFMTGRRPDTTRVYDNGVNFRTHLPDVVTIPQHFRKSGYFVARVGKIYHYGVPDQIGTNGLDDGASWDQVVNPRGRDKDEEADVINPTKGPLGGSLCWLETEGDGSDHTDGKIADATIKLLEEHKDKPFLIACGFFRPHVPCAASRNFFDDYPLESIKLPVEPAEHLAGIPPIALTVKKPNYGLSEHDQKLFTQAYHASTSLMDAQVGKVLASVDKLGLGPHTLIVFISDHGWCLGEHGQWQKMLLFEESARVPMIFYDPANKANGKVSSRPVELVDLYPTLADLCGLPAPDSVEGRSIRTLVENPAAEWDVPAFTQVSRGAKVMGRSVRTEKWRFTEWAGGEKGIELYDQEADPKEYRNVAADPKFADTIASLKALMPANEPRDGAAPGNIIAPGGAGKAKE